MGRTGLSVSYSSGGENHRWMKETRPVKRRLTAILAADAVGYSARMA